VSGIITDKKAPVNILLFTFGEIKYTVREFFRRGAQQTSWIYECGNNHKREETFRNKEDQILVVIDNY
jgi:hypothetical protein